jgi:Undecaprenyl-phosphate glucose phosphotransferase
MLKRHATTISFFRAFCDIVAVGIAWIVVYYFRFLSGWFTVPKGTPEFSKHLLLTVPVVFVCAACCSFFGLYQSKRTQSLFSLLAASLKVTLFSALFILAFFYYAQSSPYSRKLLTLFFVAMFFTLLMSHFLAFSLIRVFRSKGYNLRHYAIIGAGLKGQNLLRDIRSMKWLGLRCSFFIDNDSSVIGTEILQTPVVGPVRSLVDFVKAQASGKSIDEIYLALSGNEAQDAYPLLQRLQSTGISIRIIPDWGALTTTSKATALTIGSQMLFSAEDSPLSGIMLLAKEAFDRIVAFVLLLLVAIPMMLIAVLVKSTSKGPVLYRQIRVGMDQQEFEIFKFRTMRDHDGHEGQQAWTTKNDPRCTRIGVWLRKTSLDELPQLFNVLLGHMSLVGPRPERPEFVIQFSQDYRSYMLRHKVKSGMTGWAQAHGLRGDTSLRKRLVYDLYYTKNWSMWLDVWILILTPFHLLKGENAY